MVSKLRFANVIITTRCSARCKSCAYWRVPPDDLSYNTFKTFINYLSNTNLEGILLTGGEPLSHPNIHDFLSLLDSKGIPIILNTNGWFLDKLKVNEIKSINSLIISLDTYDENNYEIIRGHPMHTNIINSIKRIRNISPEISITISMLIQKENLQYIECMLSFVKNLGVNSLSLLVPSYESYGFGWDIYKGKHSIQKLNDMEIEKLEDVFSNFIHNSSALSYINQPPNVMNDYIKYFKLLNGEQVDLEERDCFVPEKTLTLTTTGNLKPCFYLPHEFSWSFHDDPLLNEDRNSFLLDFKKMKPHTCKQCMQFLCNKDIRPLIKDKK